MKNILSLFSIIFSVAILFYPQITIGELTGSPGGKTGSPMDNSDCTQCHTGATPSTTSNIISNIPASGYVPGTIYSITASIPGSLTLDPNGFEITCEENTFNTKTGLFLITNSNSTQHVNNGSAVTHTAAGNNLNTWSFDWEAPVAGTGDVTFYGAFIEAGYPISSNQGDYFSSSTLSASEDVALIRNNISSNNHMIFNSFTKTIELTDNCDLSVYNIEGKLLLSSNKKYTSLAHLSKGTYLIKLENRTYQIMIN